MSHILFTHFAAESSDASGIGALGVDGKAFVIQLITFGIVFLILKKYAFEPILKVMDERRKTIESGVKLGEEMRKEKADLEDKVEDMLRNARQQADEIISGAQESGKQAIKEAEDKARDKAAGILKEAEGRIDQETARARKQLEKEMVNLVSEATEAIINEKLDASKDVQLIERALKGQQA